MLVEAGRIADALDDIGRLCRAEPENPVAQGLRAVALAEADQRTGGPPAGSCPCGSGRAFSRCCGPREAAALRQFSERAGWDELRSAVLEYATRTEDLTDAILDTWSQAQERCPGGTALAPWDPELGLVAHLYQLRRDPHPSPCPPDAAVQQVAHSELGADLTHALDARFVLHR